MRAVNASLIKKVILDHAATCPFLHHDKRQCYADELVKRLAAELGVSSPLHKRIQSDLDKVLNRLLHRKEIELHVSFYIVGGGLRHNVAFKLCNSKRKNPH